MVQTLLIILVCMLTQEIQIEIYLPTGIILALGYLIYMVMDEYMSKYQLKFH